MPLAFQLKVYLESDNVFKNIKENIQHIEQSNKKKLFGNKVVVPIFLYFDDFGINSPLGPHAMSLCGAYYTIPVIPTYLLSKLNHIFLAGIFKSDHMKHFGINSTLYKIVKEFNKLEQDGIELDIEGSKQKIYFSVSLIIGDNLSLNTVLQFTKSFNANFYCRLCKRSIINMQSDTKEVPECFTLKHGLAKSDRLKLLDLYEIQSNCEGLIPPQVNPEVMALMSAAYSNRDKARAEHQLHLSKGLTALGKGLSMLLDDSENIPKPLIEKILTCFSDAGRILTDLFFKESLRRKSLISPILNKQTKDIVDQTETTPDPSSGEHRSAQGAPQKGVDEPTGPISKENVNKVHELSRLGGTEEYSFVARTLGRLITNKLASEFSYLGKRTKKPFNKLTLNKLVIEAGMLLFKNSSQDIFEKAISKWLKRAKERK
ncbi:hypothetical protein PPYR_15348 [Photinus pyralis]|uniref:DUF4806 domain-containing protein n=1 Tax=Photinus pyralis TaxID=7054 RepID=A0A5N3ZZ19_PHOPY|nr:hypothetical protein PPYR_15348 [Photinus pyralis]